MNYEQAKEYIASLSPRGIKPGLETMTALCGELGNPQDAYKTIHIAGTNGKGSVGAYIASVLNKACGRCAHFSSPAVGDCLEMYLLNGKPASGEIFAAAAGKVRAAAEKLAQRGIYPTKFETETAIAFLMFKNYGAEYAVIECGMGGALDCTNVIKHPSAVVLTPISVEHSEFLGNTIAEITRQKCGIIKDGVPVISARQSEEAETVIRQAAPNVCTVGDVHASFTGKATLFVYGGRLYLTVMSGTYQPQNAAAAIETARMLDIDFETISDGITSAGISYRFERVRNFVLDGAHNPAAAEELAQSMERYLHGKRTAFIVGCLKDKDYEKIAEITAPYAAKVYTVTPPPPRGLDAEILAESFRRAGADAESVSGYEAAVERAAGSYDTTVVFGTFTILADMRKLIERTVNMPRLNRIYNHPLYRKRMAIITEREKDRKFCRHDLAHALDVARIGYIRILEDGGKLDKELFYAAALLHDAGRYGGKPHNESGAELVCRIMPECGFTPEETESAAKAVLTHRTEGNPTYFGEVLYTADKLSRICFECAASGECYWDGERKNKTITV